MGPIATKTHRNNSYSPKTCPMPDVLSRRLQISCCTLVLSFFSFSTSLFSLSIFCTQVPFWCMTFRTIYHLLILRTYSFLTYAFIHITQGHLQEVTILLSSQDKQIKFFSRNGATCTVWNSLPHGIHHLPKNSFKIKIHNILPQQLSQENDYIDLSVVKQKYPNILAS